MHSSGTPSGGDRSLRPVSRRDRRIPGVWRRLNVRWLETLGRTAIHGCLPDLTILLDVPPRVSFQRLRRAHDRMERKARAFHERVHRGYRTLARREPQRFAVIDGAQPATQSGSRCSTLSLND